MIISIIILALTAVIAFLRALRWRRSYRELSRNFMQRISGHRAASYKAIDSSMEIYFSLLEVGALHGTGGEPMRKEMKRLLMSNPEVEDTLLSDICSLADYRYYGIISYLRANYPDLNENDLKLCSLLCFKPTAAGLMSLYNHNSSACYYNKRWRVIRRMHLPKGEVNLERFIFSLVNRLKQSEMQ